MIAAPVASTAVMPEATSVVMIVVMAVDYEWLRERGRFLYGVTMMFLVLVIVALLRPHSALGRPLLPAYDRVPLLRTGLICIVVMWLIGFVMNDSGTAIPAVGATVLVPLIIAIVLDARRTDRRLNRGGRGTGGAPSWRG